MTIANTGSGDRLLLPLPGRPHRRAGTQRWRAVAEAGPRDHGRDGQFDSPRRSTTGPFAAMGVRPLGFIAAGGKRDYHFTAMIPDTGGPPTSVSGDNAIKGSSTSARFVWSAVQGDAAPVPGRPATPRPPRDRRPPRLRVTIPKVQRLLTRRYRGHACALQRALRAHGERPRPRNARVPPEARSGGSCVPGAERSCAYACRDRALRSLRGRLLDGKPISVRLTFVATDGARNRSTVRRSVRLKPRGPAQADPGHAEDEAEEAEQRGGEAGAMRAPARGRARPPAPARRAPPGSSGTGTTPSTSSSFCCAACASGLSAARATGAGRGGRLGGGWRRSGCRRLGAARGQRRLFRRRRPSERAPGTSAPPVPPGSCANAAAGSSSAASNIDVTRPAIGRVFALRARKPAHPEPTKVD